VSYYSYYMLSRDDRRRLGVIGLVAGIVVVSMAVAMAGFTGSVGAQTHGIDSCTTITQSGTYELTSDIRNASNDPCLEIEASGVTIEGNGHRIVSTSAEPAAAIDASGVSNLAIRNVTTLYWGTGVRFVGVTDSEVSNVVTDTNTGDVTNAAYSAEFNGIALLSGSNDNVLRANEFYDAGRSGETGGSGNAILVDGSHDNLLVDNTANGPAFTGIRLWNAHRNNLTGNTIEGNPFRRGSNAGIKIGAVGDGASDGNVLRENDVYGRTLFSPYDPGLVDGIAVLSGDGNVLVDNYVDETASEGIVVTTAGTTLVSNTIHRSGEEGIAVYDPANVTDNVVTASGRSDTTDGIRVAGDADNSEIVGNEIRSTNGDGLSISGVSALEVRDNEMKYNGEWSVELTSMPVDATLQSLSIGDLDSITASGRDFRLRSGSLSGLTLPTGEQDIGIAVEAGHTSGAGTLRLDVGYDDADVAAIDESTLSMWRHDGGWSEVIGTNSVDTATNRVIADPTGFGTLAPLAANDPPTANLTASSTAVAPGERVTFDASGSADSDSTIERYEWDVDGDGTVDRTTVGATITHSYASTGTYAATVTVVDNGDDNDSSTVSVIVKSKPIASLTTSPSPTSVDANTTFNASASTYGNGTISEYRWDFDGDGTVDRTTSGAVTNYTYSTAGNYSPTVTAVGDDGRAGTGTGAVTVRENLPPNGFGISYGCNRGFCVNWVGDVVSFTAQTSSSPYTPSDPDGTIVEYRWDFDGDGTTDSVTSSSSATHAFAAAGTYTVNVTAVDDDGAKTSTSVDIRIDPREYGTITGTLTNATSGAPIPNATVDLYQDPGQFQTLSNYTRTDENGTYEIRVLAVDHNVTVDPVGYEPASSVVTVTDGGTATADLGLTPDPNDTTRKTGTITGYTYDGESNNLDGVDVAVRNKTGLVASTTSGIVGGYSIDVPVGTYDVVFSKSGYAPVTELVSVTENGTEYIYPSLENATTGGTQSPARFSVSIDSTNAPITAGDALEITATVENTGGAAGTQTVMLSTGGVQRDTASVSLASGASETVELAWATASGDAGNYTATVGTANDSDGASVRVLDAPANFSITIPSTNSPIDEGSLLNVTAIVTNVGGQTGTQSISLSVDGIQRDSTSLTLGPGATRYVSLSWQTGARDGGSSFRTARVETQNDSDSASVFVRDLEPANFSVTIDATNAPIDETGTLNVTAIVTNTGDRTGTGTIDLSVDGLPRDSTSLTLGPGATRYVYLSWTTAMGDGGQGFRTATVETENDSDTTSVLVRELAPANFSVTIPGTNSPIDEGSPLNVTAIVTNTGDVTGTQTVSLAVDGLPRDSTSLTLGPNVTRYVSLSWQTGMRDGGSSFRTVTVETDDDTATASAFVRDLEPANFSVTIDATNAPVNETETVTVTAIVTNTGDLTGTQTISLSVGGTPIDSTDLTLGPGVTRYVYLSWQTADGDAGQYNATLSSQDDSASTSIEVLDDGSGGVNTVSPGQPGFGPAIALVGLVFALLAARRRSP
jgi:PGF-CTERM protein